jgi:RNA-splicing ligase RtcB
VRCRAPRPRAVRPWPTISLRRRGLECRKDEDVIDETPMAYKSIDAVMEAQKDLVEIVHTLTQVVCVKG